jgi:hypothetical protein
MGQSYANLGRLGRACNKSFGILVEGWGEGWPRSCAAYRRDRKDNTSPLINADDTDRTKLKPTANEA